MNASVLWLIATRRDPLANFHWKRRAMLTAWQEWLTTKPSAEDIGEELFGTDSALRQISKLMGNDT